jgi:hypothetical protein
MPLPSLQRRTWNRIAVAATVAVLLIVGVIWWNRPPRLTIGVEGRQTIVIRGPQLHAAPFTPGDALSVRIAEAVPVSNGFRYDVRFMAFGPGKYDLREYLLLPGNVRPENLPEVTILVDSILPKDHKGELFATDVSPIDLHSNYSIVMGLLWSLWGLLLIPILFYGRPPRVHAAPAPYNPTTAERLQLLLERAEHDSLSPEQQADLERLLMAFWSHRLNLSAERLPELIPHLRQHPAAGRQMALVEAWLHSQHAPSNGVTARELLNDLAPELNAPAP